LDEDGPVEPVLPADLFPDLGGGLVADDVRDGVARDGVDQDKDNEGDREQDEGEEEDTPEHVVRHAASRGRRGGRLWRSLGIALRMPAPINHPFLSAARPVLGQFFIEAV
jgi:hypothetical protein